MRQRIAVIDYGMGNLRSVSKALEHVCADDEEIVVSSDRQVIEAADRVVFPGQGAMRDCMAELDRFDLRECVREIIFSRPFLGICMGLQALLDYSEEDPDTSGLGVFPGSVKRILASHRDASGARLKVPHMGWNNVHQIKRHPLWTDIADDARFYFVHSYFVEPVDEGLVAASCTYGADFACALGERNLFAVQFHPEKSQRAGLSLLRNFLKWSPPAS